MTNAEDIVFEPWPKIPRMRRTVVVTEKIDGTNAAIKIVPIDTLKLPAAGADGQAHGEYPHLRFTVVGTNAYWVAAQSRKRLISPGKNSDNAGFAGWVWANAQTLVSELGEGTHFGEWYGQSIQSRYGLEEKRFMLFNSARWHAETITPGLAAIGVEHPTVLYHGVLDQDAIDRIVLDLAENGSKHVPGQTAEGVVVFHTQSNQMYKVLCKNDDISKTEAGVS